MAVKFNSLQELAVYFWDVEPECLDIGRHRKFIIERLLKFGTPKEICWLLSTYSDSDIIEVVKASSNLDGKTANFWAIHFSIPQEEIKCLNRPFPQNCF